MNQTALQAGADWLLENWPKEQLLTVLKEITEYDSPLFATNLYVSISTVLEVSRNGFSVGACGLILQSIIEPMRGF
ncbi:MAG: hypothetical protein ACYC63_07835 [Armatimonadota bacterium]